MSWYSQEHEGFLQKGTPMELTHGNSSEAAILSRIVEPDQPTFNVELARAILAMDFNQADKEQMRQLAAKARAGTLTADEQAAINNYERVGHFLNILQLKARRSLKKGNSSRKRKPKVP
jgi:hypothetical protein